MRSIALLLIGIRLVFADPFNVRCVNVAGNVGEELTLTCRVSYQTERCCIRMYKFMQRASDDDPTICREEFRSDSCVQLANFSCPYTAKAPMRTKFRLFLQWTCGHETTVFNVNVTDTGTRNPSDVLTEERPGEKRVIDSFKPEGSDNIIAILVGCVLTLSIVVAIIGLIVWIKPRHLKSRNLTGYLTGKTMDTDSMSDKQILIHSSGSLDSPPNF